ncbi:MAG: YraN family protein [Acidimicrobiales bacterium]
MDTTTIGRAGEDAAAAWYEARGYRIVDRNWRSPRGELDLVVGCADLIVFCEVKTRRSDRYGTPAEAVDARKQAQVRRLAREWLATSEHHYRRLRFDMAAVDGRGHVEVIEGW